LRPVNCNLQLKSRPASRRVGSTTLCGAELTLFASFSGKRRIPYTRFTATIKEERECMQKIVPYSKLSEANSGGLGLLLHLGVFFFSRKETKALVLLRRRQFHTQNAAKPTLGVWGLASKK
jgi:hypothetical protein